MSLMYNYVELNSDIYLDTIFSDLKMFISLKISYEFSLLKKLLSFSVGKNLMVFNTPLQPLIVFPLSLIYHWSSLY